MQCPYCLSDVSEAATVCKTCTRDLYLFKPMMARIAELEAKVQELSSKQAVATQQVEVLVEKGAEAINKATKSALNIAGDIARFLLAPLALLLVAHFLITIVYDMKPVYLRLISMTLPLPFGYLLFKDEPRSNMLPWVIGTLGLAVASVIGMSAITASVDGTSILPHSSFEWREVIEYSLSIAFSFITGMFICRYTEGKMTPDKLQTLSTNLKTVGSAVAAILTTLVSIYTGLKALL